MTARTLYDKIWDDHVVHQAEDGTCLLYIDRHLVHEVTSPQAFEGLRMTGRRVRAPEKTIAVPDHNVPTTLDRDNAATMTADSRVQVAALDANAKEFGIHYYPVSDVRQGIVHIVGPEQGWTLPGMTVVCGDSHTATHGAFGSLAHGIGTSEVEHVLATQTLIQRKGLNMKVEITGSLRPGVTAKDITMAVIGHTGTAGGTGYVIEYCGQAIRELSMEGRMTVCNMAIEGGARAGLIAPDEKTFAYCMGRPHAPKGAKWEAALAYWQTLFTEDGAHFDKVVTIKAEDIAPLVTWGTSPEDVLPITSVVPSPSDFTGGKVEAVQRSLDYMGLTPGQKLTDIKIDTVFIGSCTNGRIEDLRAAAAILKGKKKKDGIRAMVVPGSGLVRAQAEEEGLAQIFIDAGFEWRMAGCSMCLAMNPDQLAPGERCAATSNRNFEGRQGRGGRTHLLSPAMAAAAAITGHLTDVREHDGGDRLLSAATSHTDAVGGGAPRRPRVLVIAEAANPEWVSVPLIGWSFTEALRQVADVHLVTHVRNRDAIVRQGWIEGQDFTAIDNEAIARPAWKLSQVLRMGENRGWTVVQAITSLTYPWFERLVWKKFGTAIKAGDYDIVHRVTPMTPTATGSLAARCRKAGVPFVLGPLNGGVPWPKGFEAEQSQEGEWLARFRGLMRLFPGRKRMLKSCSAIIYASRFTKADIPEKHEDRCIYLPENAIDPNRFFREATPEAGVLRACFIGRFVPLKGLSMLIAAARPFLKTGQMELHLIGDGPLTDRLKAEADGLTTVHFHGWLAHGEVQDVAARCHVLTFPSIRELGGGAVLEAMALGLAPLVVDYGGPADLVTPGVGLKVPLGTREETTLALRKALESMIADPEGVARMGKAARQRVTDSFTWPRRAEHFAQIYDWVLNRRATRPDPMKHS